MERKIDNAEDWQARLRSPDCSAADRAAYERWRVNHPDAAAISAQVERIYALSGQLSHDPWLAMATRSARRASTHARRRRVVRLYWMAAVIALLVAGGLGWRSLASSAAHFQHYATAIGEQRTVYFGDGTSVLLDTNSAVTVHYDAKQRSMTLDRGRAQFDVAPDAQRPFVVHAGRGVIHDIGTRFQVQKRPDAVVVTLLRGKVRVAIPKDHASIPLVPGQEVQYTGGRLGTAHQVDLAAVRGWTHGEIVFQNRTLADLVHVMNSYSTQKLQLGDPALGKLRVSGVFHAGDQASLVRALRRIYGLRARWISPQTVDLEPPATR